MSRYKPMRIKILDGSTNSAGQVRKWLFSYADQKVFDTLRYLNSIFEWVSKEDMTRLAGHMYGIQTKPISCIVPEYIDADDLETLSKCIMGCHDVYSQTSRFVHNKIDWEYAQRNHHIKDEDMAYYLSKKSIEDTLEIIGSWAEILQI